MHDSIRDLYKGLAEAAGAVITPEDRIHGVISKWLTAVGGTPEPADTKNNLLRKVAERLGVQALPGDSNTKILSRIAGVGPDWSEWGCLKLLGSLGGFTVTADLVSDLGFNTASQALTWTASAGATGYSIQVSATSDFSVLLSSTNVGNVLSGSALFSYDNSAPQENVYVRVVASDGSYSRNSNSVASHFNVWDLAAPAPVLSNSGGGVVTWPVGVGDIPSGYSVIMLETSTGPTGPFSVTAFGPSGAGSTAISVGVYVRARFQSDAVSFTAYSNVVLTTA